MNKLRLLAILFVSITILSLFGCNKTQPYSDEYVAADVYEVTTLGVIAKDYPYLVVDYSKLGPIIDSANGTTGIKGKSAEVAYAIKLKSGSSFSEIKVSQNGRVHREDNLMSNGDKFLTQEQFNKLEKLLGKPRIIKN